MAASTMADTIAQAATRSAIKGNSFGDNLIASLPSALGNLAGRALAQGIGTAFDGRSSRTAAQGTATSPTAPVETGGNNGAGAASNSAAANGGQVEGDVIVVTATRGSGGGGPLLAFGMSSAGLIANSVFALTDQRNGVSIGQRKAIDAGNGKEITYNIMATSAPEGTRESILEAEKDRANAWNLGEANGLSRTELAANDERWINYIHRLRSIGRSHSTDGLQLAVTADELAVVPARTATPAEQQRVLASMAQVDRFIAANPGIEAQWQAEDRQQLALDTYADRQAKRAVVELLEAPYAFISPAIGLYRIGANGENTPENYIRVASPLIGGALGYSAKLASPFVSNVASKIGIGSVKNLDELVRAPEGFKGFGAAERTAVIGRMDDLTAPGALRPGEYTIADKLPNLGTPKANYYQNMSVLRDEMRRGVPIRDASAFKPDSFPVPTALNPGRTVRQTFTGAERNLLTNRGWTFDGQYWSPPK